jgi:CBS domain containing-hemolysin-like protein
LSTELLPTEPAARRATLWRAGLLDLVGGTVVMALGVLVARWLVIRLHIVPAGGWDFWMNVEHDLPWVGAALGAIFVLTGLLRLLGAVFPKLFGSSRSAAVVRLALVAVLGAGLFVLAARLLKDLWMAI